MHKIDGAWLATLIGRQLFEVGHRFDNSEVTPEITQH